MALHSREIAFDVAAADDGELAQRAAQGDTRSFEELYRRHADSAWRVAQAVAAGKEDAADAVSEAFTNVLRALSSGRMDPEAPFRPYLLVTTRNAAIDQYRHQTKRRADLETSALDPSGSEPSAADEAEAHEDAALAAEAFRALPERWRSVLWMTEVEGIPARDVGARLGLSANSAAQLAHRARSGLRERFLQAHIRHAVEPACVRTAERLGAYAAGGLTASATADVEAHLAVCPACRKRADELMDVGGWLRGLALPIPAALGAASLARYRSLFAGTKVIRHAAFASEQLTRAVAIATSSLLALGVITAGLMSTSNGPLPTASGHQGGAVIVAPATRVVQIPVPPIASSGNVPRPGSPSDSPLPSSASTAGAEPRSLALGLPTTPSTASTSPSPPPPKTTTTPPPSTKGSGLGVTVGANLSLASLAASVSLSGGCTGISLNTSKSCAPPAPTSPGLTLTLTTPLGAITAGPVKPA